MQNYDFPIHPEVIDLRKAKQKNYNNIVFLQNFEKKPDKKKDKDSKIKTPLETHHLKDNSQSSNMEDTSRESRRGEFSY